MGLIFKARGNNSFLIFMIRFVIGWIFIIAGAKKAMNVEAFIGYVKSLDVFSYNIAFIFGFILPFAEIFFGALFLIGFMTPFTSFVLSIKEIGFIVAYSSVNYGSPQYSISPVAYHLLMLACTVGIMFSGAGAVSFDVLLDRKKKEKRQINIVGETPQMQPTPPPPPIVNEQNIKDADFTEQKNDGVS
ncbi:MAG: DoxX family protein [Ignavibacteriae bacterium]|nr:DoxX family protein [Ignavibacteriota bacterium]